jgi:hypothetical protein
MGKALSKRTYWELSTLSQFENMCKLRKSLKIACNLLLLMKDDARLIEPILIWCQLLNLGFIYFLMLRIYKGTWMTNV